MVESRLRSAAPVPAGKRPPPSAASIRGKKRSPPSAASIRGKKRPPPSAASIRGKKRSPPSAASIRGKKRPKVRSFPAPPPLHAADPAIGAFASSSDRISTTPRGRGTAETELPRNLRARSSQTTSADASTIAVASILASLSVLENDLALPLMVSNVKNVQQGRDIPSLPSGDASGSCSPDNDTSCRIGKEYTASEFVLGENVFKVCKDHREILQNLGSPSLPSPGCQAFSDAFEPGICSTSDIQASVDTHRRLTLSTSCQTEGTSKKDAKKKMPLSFMNQGVVVGDNVNKWHTRVGHFIRSYVPIDITDFRRTPQKFLDDVWNALKEEFDFGSVDPKIVRESLELRHSQRFRTMKVTLRNEILRKAASVQEAIEACPNGIDRGHWENFVKREFKPEVIAANLRNKTNKQKSSIGHTLGRHTYAQNNHSRQQKHPEKEICRTEVWLRAHEKSDGTPLDSAKEKYTTSADASSIAVASILASLSVLENNLAVPLMASNVKNVQQGRDIPSPPSGCDASGICSPDNDTHCRIGKEYTTSEFDLGENVFKVCKDHIEIPQNLGSPTLPSPGCQAFNDAFEPGICSTSDIQASVDTHQRITSSTSCQTEGTSKKDAKKKMPPSSTNQGVVVGENSAKWKTHVGHCVRSYVPNDITDFRKTPQNFLDDAWNALKQQKNPEKEICRTEDWLRAHEKPDGTTLDSAKEKYLLVKEAQNKRKNTSMSAGNSSTHVDLDSDELAEVFGRDTRGRVRGVGSNIFRKQFLPSVVTSSIVKEKNCSTYRDVKADVTELKTTISRVEDMMTAMYRWQCDSLRQEVPDRQASDADMIRRTETGSSSINKQVFASCHTGYKVKLCDREGTEVARGHVVTDSTSGMCHCRRVLPGERKVYVEEVLIGNALVYDGPQDGNSTLEGFIGGGYVIWHEARLKKV